jgi:hypothetical protein
MLPTLPDRRVRQVQLTASSQELIQRGAVLLEDALHTASLPQSQGSRVLVVRSLNMGMIHSHQSSTTLALTVEVRLRQLEASAIYAGDPAAHAYPVVYFRDEVDPYLCLAKKLSRGEPTTDWFWPVAIPGWQLSFSASEGLRHVLYGVVQTNPGVGGLLALLQSLREAGGLERLFMALDAQDGAVLLRLCHWAAPSVEVPSSLPSSSPISVASTWQALCDRWLQSWGADDPRSLWLAAVVLAVENPARLLEPELPKRAYQLLQQVTDQQRTDDALKSSEVVTRIDEPSHLDHLDGLDQSPDLISATTSASDAEVRPSIDQPNTILPSPARSSDWTPDTSATSKDFIQPVLNSSQTAEERSNSPSETEDSSEAVPDSRTSLPVETPQFTQFAGFYFLIPLLQALGITSFLEMHGLLIDLEFPKRLLREIAHRLAIPDADPIWVALSLSTPSFKDSHCCDFTAPQIWQQGIVNSGVILQNFDNQRHILLDHSGRLPLSIWRNAPPENAQAWLELPALTVPVDRLSVPASDLELISHAWITALRRWCRRYAQMGLHTLIGRPGRVAFTRTHLDVLLDHQQADIRIRRVGLDLDPGWVPWFGRVVSFHYLYGEPTA